MNLWSTFIYLTFRNRIYFGLFMSNSSNMELSLFLEAKFIFLHNVGLALLIGLEENAVQPTHTHRSSQKKKKKTRAAGIFAPATEYEIYTTHKKRRFA